MSHTSVAGHDRTSGRRARAGWFVGALLVLCVCPSLGAQARQSQLDRVFTGLVYRPLVSGELVGGSAPGVVARAMLADPVSVASPHDDRVRYRADDRVHRSEDLGGSWTTISPEVAAWPTRGGGGGAPLTAVAESPLEPGLIWVGAVDGRVHLSRDGGVSWSAPDSPVAEGVKVRAIEPSAHRGGRAYLVAEALEEAAPLVYRTDDYGSAWALLSGEFSGLPQDQAITVVREDPVREGLLFAATPVGVFASFDDGGSWDLFQFGLPEGPVTGLTVLGRDLVVSLAGGALWVMDEIGPLRQVMDGLTTGEPYLFEPSPVYLDHLPADEGVADGRGAIFDYLLPSNVGRVRLEVLDVEGRMLATFSGERQSGRGGGSPGAAGEPEFRRVPGTRSGVHRIVWDLTTAVDGTAERVPPGSYLLRLTVDGLVRERTFEAVPAGG